jgi:hypothetical protein
MKILWIGQYWRPLGQKILTKPIRPSPPQTIYYPHVTRQSTIDRPKQFSMGWFFRFGPDGEFLSSPKREDKIRD